MLSRRRALGLIGAAGAMGSGLIMPSSAKAAESDSPSGPPGPSAIALAAWEAGVLFGLTEDSWFDSPNGDALRQLVLQEAHIFASGNSFKDEVLHHDLDTFDWSSPDQMMQYAKDSYMPIHAHNLVWNDNNAEWMKQLSGNELRYQLDRHLDTVVEHYLNFSAYLPPEKRKQKKWIVVNEPIAPWEREEPDPKFRKGPWYTAFGKDYIARAFRRVRAIDGEAKLILNEANTERDDSTGQDARSLLLQLVDELQQEQVPFDVVGLQGHLLIDRSTFAENAYADFLAELATKVPEIHITEFDVDDRGFVDDIDERDAQVAKQYSVFAKTALANTSVKEFIVWGVDNQHSWYNRLPAGQSTGRPARPLLFDDSLQPTPAYLALLDAFKHAPERVRNPL